MRKKISCSNPNCRKEFTPTSDDQQYCSEECRIEATTPRSHHTTVTVRNHIKGRLYEIQMRAYSEVGRKLSMTDILATILDMVDVETLLNELNNRFGRHR